MAGSQPAGVVVAPGSVWVSNSGDATVQRFNPGTFEQGAVRDYGVGRRPAGIAYGEGAIWVANTSDDSVTRIDPAAGSTRTIDVGRGPAAVAVGSGSVWVANTADNTVSRIDPATHDVVETIEIGNAPYGIAVSDELVWITAGAVDGRASSRQTAVRSRTGRRTMQPTRFETSVSSLKPSAAEGA